MAGHIEGRIWSSEQDLFINGVVRWNDQGRITSVDSVPSAPKRFIVPGFIDLHVHGAGGSDTMDASSEALEQISGQLPRYGVTGFLATTLTATPGDLAMAVQAVGTFQPRGNQAEILGVHLEGPYIDPDHRGAQPLSRIRPIDRQEIEDLVQRSAGRVRLITIAPEMEGALEQIAWLRDQGIRVNLGHTGASLETAEAALDRGANGVTHLFNAMPSLHHRDPGLVGLALSDPRMFVEVIADGVHIHPHVVRLVFEACRGRVVAVTDGISAVGLPNGKHRLGELTVDVDEKAVRLPSGTLAGSKLTLDQAYRNLLSWGISESQVIDSLSHTPWSRLGQVDRGRIASGQWADLAVLSEGREVEATLLRGHFIFQSD